MKRDIAYQAWSSIIRFFDPAVIKTILITTLIVGGPLYYKGWARGMERVRPIFEVVTTAGQLSQGYHRVSGAWPDSVEQINGALIIPGANQLRYQNWLGDGLFNSVINRWEVNGDIPPGAVLFEPLTESGQKVGVVITAYNRKSRVLRRLTIRDPKPSARTTS